MLAEAILWSGLILRPLILTRGYQSRMLSRYAWFYWYILSGFTADAVLYLLWGRYANLYWVFQFLTLAFGCGVLLEIFKHVLSPYPGAERFARILLLMTFVVIFLFGLIYPHINTSLTATRSHVELERDVRTAQTIFFVAILAVIFHYSIPRGKNMRGMMSGYGLYLCASLFTLTFRAYLGHGFDAIWRVLQPLFSSLTLCIWLYALWAYHPNPVPSTRIELESDYEELAALTKGRIDALRSHLGRSGHMRQ
jgi:hypothetical protein